MSLLGWLVDLALGFPEWDEDVAVYAPPIVRHHQPWPGAGRPGGQRPYRPWPGGERR